MRRRGGRSVTRCERHPYAMPGASGCFQCFAESVREVDQQQAQRPMRRVERLATKPTNAKKVAAFLAVKPDAIALLLDGVPAYKVGLMLGRSRDWGSWAMRRDADIRRAWRKGRDGRKCVGRGEF